MPIYSVETPARTYPVEVERGIIGKLAEYLPAGSGKTFVVTTADVWDLYGAAVRQSLEAVPHHVLLFPGGEPAKRLSAVEKLAEEMVEAGGDRTALVVAFGGGIVNDVGGFLAAIFMRGVPVIQIPTTLLAQVDAGIGGKTGVNLANGKNLLGSFHQPLAVLIDPGVLGSLPDREYRSGLYEVIKHGIIRSPKLFDLMASESEDVLARKVSAVDWMIEESVRIKTQVVSADEKENDLRRILNFGHTFGHALEAETGYSRFLHGEAVGFGMKAAVRLSRSIGMLGEEDERRIIEAIDRYGTLPSPERVSAESIVARMYADKKTLQGRIHLILPDRIGHVRIVSGLGEGLLIDAVRAAMA
jgi:3-dehydroquinate synthase